MCKFVYWKGNNNNEYLQRQTRTGPNTFSTNTYLLKFNAYKMNACTHARKHTDLLCNNNYNSGYLQRLTHTGPKHLHVL